MARAGGWQGGGGAGAGVQGIVWRRDCVGGLRVQRKLSAGFCGVAVGPSVMWCSRGGHSYCISYMICAFVCPWQMRGVFYGIDEVHAVRVLLYCHFIEVWRAGVCKFEARARGVVKRGCCVLLGAGYLWAIGVQGVVVVTNLHIDFALVLLPCCMIRYTKTRPFGMLVQYCTYTSLFFFFL